MTTEQSSGTTFEDIPCLRPYADKIRDYMGSRPAKTVRVYHKQFLYFARWAQEVERQAEHDGNPRTVLKMPIDPSDLAAYAQWLFSRGLSLSSIRTYLSSLRTLHIAANVFNPTDSDVVKAAMANLREKHSQDELRHARVLSDAELESIFSVLHTPRRTGRRMETPEMARKRANVDRALLLTMIHAGMRRGEAADLIWDRVRKREDGAGMVLLPVKWERGRGVWVPIDEECFQTLMAIKPEGADRSSSVFNLSVSQVNRRLKRMCEEAGIDSKDVSGYTPRATLIRLLFEEKAPDNFIAARLRLKPHDTLAVYMDSNARRLAAVHAVRTAMRLRSRQQCRPARSA